MLFNNVKALGVPYIYLRLISMAGFQRLFRVCLFRAEPSPSYADMCLSDQGSREYFKRLS